MLLALENIMKSLRAGCVSAVLAAICVAVPAGAFHSGGAAQCEGCHTMHNTSEGATMTGTSARFQSGPFLLRGSDQSSACLNCHQQAGDTGPTSYHVSTAENDMPVGSPPLQLTPGGDFGWLKKSYSWAPAPGSASVEIRGERHGHNIVAVDFNYVADITNINAPGSSTPYPSDSLHCSSCHDPHGAYRIVENGVQSTSGKPIRGSGSYGSLPDAGSAVGTYRLLAGVGYKPKSLAGGPAFTHGAPFAVAPVDYNRSEESGDTRVSYGKGTSPWCTNCHALMHAAPGSSLHPADKQLGDVAQTYNAYRKTGSLDGTVATAYLSLVPFEQGDVDDLTALKDATATSAGPVATDKVSCLSCHRAHASGFSHMTRFAIDSNYITVADASGNAIWPDPVMNPSQSQGRTVAETRQAYYGRHPQAFSPYQRVLCNKCHARD